MACGDPAVNEQNSVTTEEQKQQCDGTSAVDDNADTIGIFFTQDDN